MNRDLTLWGRFVKVVSPTKLQILSTVLLSVAVLMAVQSAEILHRLGISDTAVQDSQSQVQERFSVVSHSLLASNIALVGFWSIVGLVAYLICWAGYNFFVEARNEVTLETQYENLGGHGGIVRAIVVKTVAMIGLVAIIFIFQYVLSLAVALTGPVIEQIFAGNLVAAIAGIFILSVEIYLVFTFFALAFSAWYRQEAFTEN
jgi:hypothetical protein